MKDDEAVEHAHDVMDALRHYRLAQTTERELQSAIEAALLREGVAFQREASIGPGERPDFLLEHGVALEVKIQCPASALLRQLRRYAESDKVRAVLLVTTRFDHRPPDELEGKPVLTLHVGGAFR